MHSIKHYFLLFIACLLFTCSLPEQQLALVGTRVPSSRYFLINGNTHSLAQNEGKILALVFWDSDCPHCLGALPDLDELAASYRGNPDVEFIAISIDSAGEERQVRETIAELGIKSLDVAFSGNDVDDEAYRALNGDRVPYMLLADEGGVIRWIGTSEGDLEDELQKLLETKGSRAHEQSALN